MKKWVIGFILLNYLAGMVPEVNAQMVGITNKDVEAMKDGKDLTHYHPNAETVNLNPYLSTVKDKSEGMRDKIYQEAQRYIGTPYVWGGTSRAGIDCSGLVQVVFRAHGIALPRITQEQQLLGKRKSIQQAKKGDLYFWEDNRGDVYHVAIANGDGGYVHAPSPGQYVGNGHIYDFSPSFMIRILP